jgi:Flp pilus assembly protein TadG
MSKSHRTTIELKQPERSRQKAKCRGFVLVTMAGVTIALLGALGLAVDMGHTFIAKNESQAFVDAAALAATLQLNGTTTGITAAQTAVTSLKDKDKWNFSTTSVGTTIVEFATASAGPWVSSPNPATDYKYTRVKVSISVPMYFVPAVLSTKVFSMTVNSQAIAGQIDLSTIGTGLSPFSGVVDPSNATPPNYGLVVGNEYAIQWAHFSGTANGCSPTQPDKCFNGGRLCNDDSKAAAWAVASNWASAFSGYWGATSGSLIESYIVGTAQLQAVSVNPPTNMVPVLTSGQKNSQGGWLDWRVNHDTDSLDNTWTQYKAALAAGTANGMRLITVPLLKPLSVTDTDAIAYGQYMLESNAKMTGGSLQASNLYTQNNGNDAWCAIYVGTLDFGQVGPGVGGTTGASVVRLVQ